MPKPISHKAMGIYKKHRKAIEAELRAAEEIPITPSLDHFGEYIPLSRFDLIPWEAGVVLFYTEDKRLIYVSKSISSLRSLVKKAAYGKTVALRAYEPAFYRFILLDREDERRLYVDYAAQYIVE
jgi:hypothetical protein